jgi:hypothetical protein
MTIHHNGKYKMNASANAVAVRSVGTAEPKTHDRPANGMRTALIAICVAMIAVSLAGLAHDALGLDWGLHQQVFYALVGGLSSWQLLR